MPQPYHNAVITDAGLALLNQAQTGEAAVRFTRMVTGDGIYAEDEKTPSALQKRTGLKSEKNSYALSSMETTSDGGVKLAALLTNQDPATGEALVTDGYYINEIGLYAEEKEKGGNTEVLYSIAVAMVENGEYMPPYDGGVPAEIVQEYHAAISNSQNISIHLTGTGAPMLAEDAEKRFQEILEKIPPVDSELDSDSENPVQNQAVAGKAAELTGRADSMDAWAVETDAEIQQMGEEIQSHAQSLEDLDNNQKNLADKVAAMEPTVIERDIPASGWEGDEAPYTNTLEIEGVKPNSIVEVSLSKDADTGQVRASMNGQIVDGGQAEGFITLRAFGQKPDVDIPVVVIVRGGA